MFDRRVEPWSSNNINQPAFRVHSMTESFLFCSNVCVRSLHRIKTRKGNSYCLGTSSAYIVPLSKRITPIVNPHQDGTLGNTSTSSSRVQGFSRGPWQDEIQALQRTGYSRGGKIQQQNGGETRRGRVGPVWWNQRGNHRTTTTRSR